jgi:hypothetical protein
MMYKLGAAGTAWAQKQEKVMTEILHQADPRSEHAYLAGSASVGLGSTLRTGEKR